MARPDDAERQPDADNGSPELMTPRARPRGRKSFWTWFVAGAGVIWLMAMLVTVNQRWLTDEPNPAHTADAGGSTQGADRPLVGRSGTDIGAGGARVARPRAREPRLIPAAERAGAPSFTLPDIDGGTATLADYAGRVLLLNFWATWCGPCRAEMPWFVEFQGTFADQGFAVLGVSTDEPGWDLVRPFLEAAPVNYRIALADTVERLAPFPPGIGDILPTTWLIDRQGRIAAEHVGIVNRDAIDDEIQLLLGE